MSKNFFLKPMGSGGTASTEHQADLNGNPLDLFLVTCLKCKQLNRSLMECC
jgi:hypothetical protein